MCTYLVFLISVGIFTFSKKKKMLFLNLKMYKWVKLCLRLFNDFIFRMQTIDIFRHFLVYMSCSLIRLSVHIVVHNISAKRCFRILQKWLCRGFCLFWKYCSVPSTAGWIDGYLNNKNDVNQQAASLFCSLVVFISKFSSGITTKESADANGEGGSRSPALCEAFIWSSVPQFLLPIFCLFFLLKDKKNPGSHFFFIWKYQSQLIRCVAFQLCISAKLYIFIDN